VVAALVERRTARLGQEDPLVIDAMEELAGLQVKG
jgi:hypothetical protein